MNRMMRLLMGVFCAVMAVLMTLMVAGNTVAAEVTGITITDYGGGAVNKSGEKVVAGGTATGNYTVAHRFIIERHEGQNYAAEYLPHSHAGPRKTGYFASFFCFVNFIKK